MLKGLLNIFLGDKSSKDIKDIQPIVDAILIEEQALESLTADQLREKSTELKSIIQDHVAPLQNEIIDLKAKATTMSEADLDAKEAVFEKIDSLELEINEELEIILNEILPQAFALVKETAKRFSAEGDVFFRSTLKTEEGADIDGYIKRLDNGKSNLLEEEIDIEEIVNRPDDKKLRKPKVIPVTHKEAV